MKLSRLLPVLMVGGGAQVPYYEKVKAIQLGNLIGYWRMNETSGTTMADSSAEANNGAYSAGMKLANAAGPDGELCPLFDASGYTTPYSAGLNTDMGDKKEFTISVWVKIINESEWADATLRKILRFYTDSNNNFYIEKNATAGRIYFYIKAGATAKDVAFATTRPTGWFNVVITHSLSSGDTGELKGYINGMQGGVTGAGLGTWVGNLSSAFTMIGSIDATPTNPWAGWLAHVAVWKVALTPEEVALLCPSSMRDGLTLSSVMTVIPSGRDQHGFTECGGKLYSVAGEISGAAQSNTVYEYDPTANTWATKEVLPISVQSPGVESVGGKVYCIGGLTATGVTDKVYEYDPTGNTWTEKTAFPVAREDFGTAVVNGLIYCFGGVNPVGAGTVYKRLDIYNPATDTWTTGADMPDYKLLGNFGCAYGGKVYAIGATNTFADYPTLHVVAASYVYDPTTDAWATIADVPTPRCYAEVVELGGKLYSISGCTTNITTNSLVMDVYDPATDTWAALAAPLALRGAGAAVYNGVIYLSGGFASAVQDKLFRLS